MLSHWRNKFQQMNLGDTNIQSIAHGIHETTKIMWKMFAHFMFIFGGKKSIAVIRNLSTT